MTQQLIQLVEMKVTFIKSIDIGSQILRTDSTVILSDASEFIPLLSVMEAFVKIETELIKSLAFPNTLLDDSW